MNSKIIELSQRFALGLLIGLVVGTAVYLYLGYEQVHTLREKVEAIHESSLEADGKIAQLSVEVNNLQKGQQQNTNKQQRFEAFKEQIGKQIAVLREQSSEELESKEETSAEIKRLERQLQDLNGAVFEALVAPSVSKEGVTFEYFESDDWSEKVRHFVSLSRSNGMSILELSANKGTDKIQLTKSKSYTIDGITHKGVEIYDALNGYRNQIFVAAPGFTNLDGKRLTIIGDPGLDKVYLDGCLDYRLFDEDGRIFEIKDSKGDIRYLEIPGEVEFHKSEKCSGQYFSLYKLSDGNGDWSLKGDFYQKNSRQKQVNDKLIDRLKIYKDWLGKIQNEDVLEAATILVAAIEDQVLPPLFPRSVQVGRIDSFILEPIGFNKLDVETFLIDEGNECTEASYPDKGHIIRGVSEGHLKIKCDHGDQFYVLTDDKDDIEDVWGNDVVFPKGGDDKIDLGAGQDIVFLDKNWGKKQITKTCENAEPYKNGYYRSQLSDAAYVGLGFAYEKIQNYLFVKAVFPGSPAEKIGMKKGDRIYRVAGRLVDMMRIEEILEILKTSEPETTEIEFFSAEQNKNIRTDISKGVIYFPYSGIPSDAEKLKKKIFLQERWPYKYNNFIVLMPDISKESLDMSEAGKIINSDTGDELTYSPCFEIVFMSDKRKK